jgi:hypothetical protein
LKIKEILMEIMNDDFGHGGGDFMLVQDFYKALSGDVELGTTLDRSIESHLMALAAEKSRVTGQVCYLHKDKNEQ